MSTVTVVIPCRNEVQFIEETVAAIFNCSLPDDTTIAVYVVDGMSNDGTREKISELQTVYPTLKLVDNEKQLTPFAFNLGIYAGGKSDYVQIVGARHVLSKNYLQSCIQHLQSSSEIWCVGGRIENDYVNEAGRIISKAMATTFGMGLGNFRTLSKSGFTDTVTSPMYPYWVFEKIGFFDEELVRNQDDDFNFRVTQAGGKIYYENSISLKYYVRGNFSQLWKQFFQYGYWKVFVNKKHKAVTTFRQLIPPAFVVFLFLIPFSFLIHLFAGLAFTAMLLVYLLLAFIFGLKTGENMKQKLLVTATFPILHVSYGLGYLKGIFHFMILNRKPSKKEAQLSR